MNQKALEMAVAWLLLLGAVLQILESRRMNRGKQTLCIVVYSILTAYLLAERTLGLDLKNYYVLYQTQFYPFLRTHSLSQFFDGIFNRSYEPIHYFFGNLLGPNGIHAYLFLCTLATLLCVCYISSKKQSPCIYYGIFYLMYFFQIDVTRQFLGTSFFLLSLGIESTINSFLVAIMICVAHFGSAPAAIAVLFRNFKMTSVNLFLVLSCVLLSFFVLKNAGIYNINQTGLTYLDVRTGASASSDFGLVNVLRLIERYSFPVLTALFIFFTPSFFEVSEESRDVKSAVSYAKLSLAIFALLLILQQGLIAYRLFNMLAAGNFLLFGDFLERHRGEKEAFLGVLFFLFILNVVHTCYYMFIAIVY